MIIQEQVEDRICNKEQIEYYSKLGYKPEWKKVILIIVEHLMVKSNIKIDVICDICGTDKKLNYSKYTKNTKNLTTDYCCSNKCAITKQENTCLEKYGVRYMGEREDMNLKSRKTKFEKYGDEFFNNHGKYKKTCLEKYGVESSNKSTIVKEKIKESFLNKYNVDSYSKTKEFKEKFTQTCLQKYGVRHAMQKEEFFLKASNNSLKIKKYKDTGLLYQGTYEKYFLDCIYERGIISLLSRGKHYKYFYGGEYHTYYSDFLLEEKIIIEIKSGWTYNKNGKDMTLELINETKWQSVRDSGDDIIILKSKEEIKNYVKNLDIIVKK
jgi:hypothetical protein